MKRYQLKLTLKSPAVTASGEGYGAVIDSDVVYDELGVPYIPAKRIKGCLKDAAEDVKDMLRLSEVPLALDIEAVFGKPGSTGPAPARFSNLFVENYDNIRQWLEYYIGKQMFSGAISREGVLSCFTQIRQQTAIGLDGVALDSSLRTCRAVEKGTVFFGDVFVEERGEPADSACEDILVLACAAFRRMGTSRNRGFGEVECLLTRDGSELAVPKKLEELCTK